MDANRFILTATVRRRSDRKKWAFLQPIAGELLDGDRPTDLAVWNIITSKLRVEFDRMVGAPYEVTGFAAAEQMPVEVALTQTDFDSDPQWREWGYKVGDTYTDWITLSSAELDKQYLAAAVVKS